MNDLNETLRSLRVNYQLESLDVKNSLEDPLLQFDHWFREAVNAQCDEPNAFTLSTVSKGGWPRSRILLLKGIHEKKFVFYTNYKSSKGEEIEHCNKVSMTFLWLPLQRQVRVEGIASRVSSSLSDEYFKQRPRGSQVGAIASPQSQRMASRESLEKLFQVTEEKLKSEPVLARPENWGGYEVTPVSVEFWQGRSNRMHDRISYELESGAWSRYRLAP